MASRTGKTTDGTSMLSGGIETEYVLTDESKRFLDTVNEATRTGRRKSYNEQSVEQAREGSLQTARVFGGEVNYDGDIKDIIVPVPHLEEGIPVRLYNPNGCPDNAPILIYFHGGGGCVGSRQTVDTLCRSISKLGLYIVVNVEYRLAPEHQYPEYTKDAISVTKWVMQNKSKIGGGEQSIVGVGGDSHGGNVSTITCHEVKGLDYQVLIYPSVDLSFSYPSHEEFKTGYLIEKAACEWFMNNLCRSWSDRIDPYGSCIFRDQSSFDSQPPCLLIITECDPLRDEGLAYGEKLKAAGVRVEVLFLKGTIHAFFHLPAFFKDTCKKSYDKVVEFINSIK
ncbi:ethyl acetate hydrolase-like [Glandiceps talaboti]